MVFSKFAALLLREMSGDVRLQISKIKRCAIQAFFRIQVIGTCRLCRGLCHARSIVIKSTAFRFATADDFITIPLPSHTLRAALANLQGRIAFFQMQFVTGNTINIRTRLLVLTFIVYPDFLYLKVKSAKADCSRWSQTAL